MRTPENLCIKIKPSDFINKSSPMQLSLLEWGGPLLTGFASWHADDSTLIIAIHDTLHQQLRVEKAGIDWYFICPDCKTVRKCLWLPPYGRHFACKVCWNVGDEPASKPEPGEGKFTKLLQKFLQVMKP